MLFREFKQISSSKDPNRHLKKDVYFFSYIFSIRIAHQLYKLGFSANFVTLLFGLTGITSSILYFNNFPIIGYFLWRLHMILDLADGDIARVTKFSSLGTVVDKFQHIIINLSIYSSLFLSKDYFISDINNIKLFISLLPIFLINFTFTIITSSLKFNTYTEYKNNLITNIIKYTITFEGLLLFSTILFTLKNLGFIVPNQIFSYLLIFYNITYLLIVLKKISIFKNRF